MLASPRSRVTIVILLGLIVIVAVLTRTLLRTPQVVIATNSVKVAGELAHFPLRATVCQAGETLPASTDALRMSLIAYVGPAVSVTVSENNQVVAAGHHGPGWVAGSLTIQLHPAVKRQTPAVICLTRDPVDVPLGLFGNLSSARRAATVNGRPLQGRMRIEYLTRGHRSWLALANDVIRRLGLGHEPHGGWVAIPLTAAMLAAIGAGVWVLRREAL
jgi:hypothetical protein